MGGAPKIQQINPLQLISDIFQGTKLEVGYLPKFLKTQPELQHSQDIANRMYGQVGSLTAPLQTALKNLPSITGLTNPLQAALNRDAGIVSSGGAMTPREAASLNQDLSAQLGASGMGRSPAGVYTGALNTYNEMQNRVNTAIGQEQTLAPAIEGLRAQDIGIRTAIPTAIQGIEGTAQSAALGAESGNIGSLTGLMGALSGPIASQVLANQQAQAASATAGANKAAGLETGGLGLGSSLAGLGGGIAIAV